MAKVDLSHAFMHFDISPELQQYCAVEVGDKAWTYTKMPWGTSFGPYVLQSFTEAISQVVEMNTGARVVVYMDDFCIVAVEK